MRSRMHKLTRGYWLVAVLVLLFCGVAQARDIEGAWRLVMRKLPDGTTLVPPAIHGSATTHAGVSSRIVFWHTPDGKPAFVSAISNVKMSETEYTEKLLFMVFDDGSGKPPVYNLAGDTKTSPITHDGQRITYKLPFDPPSVTIDGDKSTATAEGAFVDYWERVR